MKSKSNLLGLMALCSTKARGKMEQLALLGHCGHPVDVVGMDLVSLAGCRRASQRLIQKIVAGLAWLLCVMALCFGISSAVARPDRAELSNDDKIYVKFERIGNHIYISNKIFRWWPLVEAFRTEEGIGKVIDHIRDWNPELADADLSARGHRISISDTFIDAIGPARCASDHITMRDYTRGDTWGYYNVMKLDSDALRAAGYDGKYTFIIIEDFHLSTYGNGATRYGQRLSCKNKNIDGIRPGSDLTVELQSDFKQPMGAAFAIRGLAYRFFYTFFNGEFLYIGRNGVVGEGLCVADEECSPGSRWLKGGYKQDRSASIGCLGSSDSSCVYSTSGNSFYASNGIFDVRRINDEIPIGAEELLDISLASIAKIFNDEYYNEEWGRHGHKKDWKNYLGLPYRDMLRLTFLATMADLVKDYDDITVRDLGLCGIPRKIDAKYRHVFSMKFHSVLKNLDEYCRS